MVSASDLFLYGSYSAPAPLKSFYIFQATILLLPPEHYSLLWFLRVQSPCSPSFLKLTRTMFLKDYSRSLSKPIPSEEQEKGPRKGSGTLRSSLKAISLYFLSSPQSSPLLSPQFTSKRKLDTTRV